MARGHYEPYGASANRGREFMRPPNSSLARLPPKQTEAVAVPQERGREGYDKTGKGLCEMADREERREREGYGNDVMKVYEGGTVAAAASARRGEEDGKKCQEQKFSYIRHRSRHHHFLPLLEDVLAFSSFFLNASSNWSTLAQ